jgi:serine/threonine-protein kinase RsbW
LDEINYKREWHIQSKRENVPDVIREILKDLGSRIRLTDDEHDEIRLIFNELLYNAVLHGNQNDKNRQVHIHIKADSRFIYAIVRDEGDGFDLEEIIQKLESEDMVLKESGRGMKLVMALTDEVEYSDQGRQITFIKEVGLQHG